MTRMLKPATAIMKAASEFGFLRAGKLARLQLRSGTIVVFEYSERPWPSRDGRPFDSADCLLNVCWAPYARLVANAFPNDPAPELATMPVINRAVVQFAPKWRRDAFGAEREYGYYVDQPEDIADHLAHTLAWLRDVAVPAAEAWTGDPKRILRALETPYVQLQGEQQVRWPSGLHQDVLEALAAAEVGDVDRARSAYESQRERVDAGAPPPYPQMLEALREDLLARGVI